MRGLFKYRLLFLAVLLALIFRLVGINHGLPLVIHPDEPTIVRSALGIRFDPNPHHFDWPHLYIYLNYFVYMVFAKLRNLVPLAIFFREPDIFYLLTRIFSAFLGALTLVPVYLSARKLFNSSTAAILSALTLGLFPFAILRAHYTMPDVAMVFFLTWSIYFSVCLTTSNFWRYFLLTGFFLGFSTSAKYNGALVFFVIPIANYLYCKKVTTFLSPKNLIKLATSAVALFIGFFLGTPYALLDYKTFIRTDSPVGALWQFTNVGSADFAHHLVHLSGALTSSLPQNLGYTPLLLALGYLPFAIFQTVKKKQYDVGSLVLVYLPFLFTIWYVTGFAAVRGQYFMILYPFLAIISGYVLNAIYVGSTKKCIKYCVIAAFFIPLVFSACFQDIKIVNGDTQKVYYDKFGHFFTASDTVIYNSNALDPVIAATRARYLKTLPNGRACQGSYLLIAYDNENTVADVFKKMDLVSTEVKTVYFFDNTYNLGQKLILYKCI